MPAVACYLRKPGQATYRPFAIDVLRIEEGQIADVTAFNVEPVREALDLPASL
jgi:RNA polymerase sigma-70 factor (ECF subfamily)